MACLDIETLCMYLDYELDTAQHQAAAAHLHMCQHCAANLRSLQHNDTSVETFWAEDRDTALPSPACYDMEDLLAYTSGLLAHEDTQRLEQHLHTCDLCAIQVKGIHHRERLLRQEPLLMPPAALMEHVRSQESTEGPQTLVHQLGRFVVQVARHGLRLLREATVVPEEVWWTYSERLLPAGAWRSAQHRPEAPGSLEIRQVRHDLDLRVQVEYTADQTVSLRVQLQQHAAPVPERRVVLSRDGVLRSAKITSISGSVDFPRLSPGRYTISLPEDQLAMQCILQATEESLSRE